MKLLATDDIPVVPEFLSRSLITARGLSRFAAGRAA